MCEIKTLKTALENGLSANDPDQIGTLAQDLLALLEAITLVADGEDESRMTQILVESITGLLKGDACYLFRWEFKAETLSPWGSSGGQDWDTAREIAGILLQDLRSEPFLQVRRKTSEALEVSNPHLDELMLKAGLQVLLALPLGDPNRPLGLILVEDCTTGEAFSETKIALGRKLAEQSASAIERLRLLNTIQQGATEMESVYQACLRLTASLSLPEVLNAILQEALNLLKNAINARIFIYDKDSLIFGADLWASGDFSKTQVKPSLDALSYRAARKGKMMIHAHQGSSGSVLSLPLKIGRRIVGVMTIDHAQPQFAWSSHLPVLRILADQAAIAIENAHLLEIANQQARTDPLTGLPNRRALDERLENEIRRSSRYQHPFTLIMLDLNGFKSINDTYGHPMGDNALKQVTACMSRYLRDTDFFARFGGDEFAIILPETDPHTAQRMAERLAETVENCPLIVPGSQTRPLSISIGLASYPQDAISAAGLLSLADQSLYQAKALLPTWKLRSA